MDLNNTLGMSIAPINIAVIKYWGKKRGSEHLNVPANDSISITLNVKNLHTRTVISKNDTIDKVILNGEEIRINERMQRVITFARILADKYNSPLKCSKLLINSENNFPTAAGLASSASGYAALARELICFYAISPTPVELFALARLGSGSACRSLLNGFVHWKSGIAADGSDSIPVQISDELHWPDLQVFILITSSAKKHLPSTAGMQSTVTTSQLFPTRLSLIPPKIDQMKKAILEKDFHTFAALTMQDSNQFHAVCMDTIPPIMYLSDQSRHIINTIELWNARANEIKAAYTFDAGPNAVVFLLEKNIDEWNGIMARYFGYGEYPPGIDIPCLKIDCEKNVVEGVIHTTVS